MGGFTSVEGIHQTALKMSPERTIYDPPRGSVPSGVQLVPKE